ncbi:MAG: lysylphosphatidylglycerol synthase domain-containing protein [Bacteroidota bacterium]
MRQFSHLFKWVRIPVSLCAIIWVVYQIKTHESWTWLPEQEGTIIHYPSLVIFSIGLVAVNLMMEAQKWRASLTHLGESHTSGFVLKSVLIGLGLGLWMPGRIGEFPGRLSQIPEPLWVKGGVLMSVGRVSQMLASLSCFGFMWMIISAYWDLFPFPAFLPPLMVVLAWGVLWLLKSRKPFSKLPFSGKMKLGNELYQAFLEIPTQLWGKLIGWSFGRYVVFSLQYILLLKAMGLTESWLELVGLISMIFGIRSFFPSLAFADVGVRESVAVGVAQWMGVSVFPVLMATLILFFINLVIPALIGVYLFWQAEEERLKNRKVHTSVS